MGNESYKVDDEIENTVNGTENAVSALESTNKLRCEPDASEI